MWLLLRINLWASADSDRLDKWPWSVEKAFFDEDKAREELEQSRVIADRMAAEYDASKFYYRLVKVQVVDESL